MNKSGQSRTLGTIIGIAMLVFVVQFVYLAWAKFFAVDSEAAFAFGSSLSSVFSAAGTLVSAILLFGTVYLQRQQLFAALETMEKQAAAMQAQTAQATSQLKIMEQQSRLAWQGTVTAVVVEAIKMRQQFDGRPASADLPAINGLHVAMERTERLVDQLTRRGSVDFVDKFLRDSWREAVGLDRLKDSE